MENGQDPAPSTSQLDLDLHGYATAKKKALRTVRAHMALRTVRAHMALRALERCGYISKNGRDACQIRNADQESTCASPQKPS